MERPHAGEGCLKTHLKSWKNPSKCWSNIDWVQIQKIAPGLGPG